MGKLLLALSVCVHTAAAFFGLSTSSNMCKVRDDFIGSLQLHPTDSTFTCNIASAYLLSKVGKTAWSQITATEVETTTWTDPLPGTPGSLSALIVLVGPSCCGGAAKARFMDDSNMCKVPDDFIGSLQLNPTDPTFTCNIASAYLLSKVGKTAWSQITATEVETTTWKDPELPPGTPGSLSLLIARFGPSCCGGAAKARFMDDSNMCKAPGDFNESLSAEQLMPGLDPGFTCGGAHDMVYGVGKMTWSQITTADMTTTVVYIGGLPYMLSALIVVWGPLCCGGGAKARFMDDSNMCKVSDDLLGSLQLDPTDPGFTCNVASAYLLMHAGKTAWSQITDEDVETTTMTQSLPGRWIASEKPSLSSEIAKFGPRCCGGATKARFVPADRPVRTIVVPVVILAITGAVVGQQQRSKRLAQQQAVHAGVISAPKVGFGAATSAVVISAVCFVFLLRGVLYDVWSAVAGLEYLCLPALLNILFAWRFWHWVHHELGGTRPARGGAQVAPERRQSHLHDAVLAVEAANQLRPAHEPEPAPRPVVAPAGAPGAPYLASCAAAAAALAAELAAAIDDAQRAAMLKQLGQHYQLRWEEVEGAGSAAETPAAEQTPASSGSAAGDGAEVPASFDAAAKALLVLVMRYPASAAPLAQGAFAWVAPPLRAGGEAAVARALRTWTERTSSAADSALFSSMGVWVSPAARTLVTLFALLFTVLVMIDLTPMEKRRDAFRWLSFLTAALGSSTAAVLLHTGRRELARWAWAAGFVVTAVCYVVHTVLADCAAAAAVEPLSFSESTAEAMEAIDEFTVEGTANTAVTGPPGTCGGWGVYADPTKQYDYTHDPNRLWSAVVMVSMFLAMAGLATHPHRTFGLIFVGVPLLVVLFAVKVAAVDNWMIGDDAIQIDVTAIMAAGLTGIGTYLWMGRAHALMEAHRLAAEDAARYVRLWERLLATEGFRETLLSLENAWREVQNGALRLPKRQVSAPTLHALLTQADELNDLLQAKLHDICAAHGGEHHACGIKAEARALQKVFRSYKGDWRRLSDLCRSSLVFDAIASLEACLRAIGADTELQVVHAGDAKMRLREGFDAEALSGGYRDIQLCVRLNTAEARVRGVHEHLCEVQLHFAPIIALKSGGGHKTYVLRRNLSGQ
jgi:hypothetical protein